MKQLFDEVSLASSRLTTKRYSTSFSLGIHCLNKRFHDAIYSIYGFVRFADEIVDSFHGYNKELLLSEFKEETYKAIERKISINPILNSFQNVVHTYSIDRDSIDYFLRSMEMDLRQKDHSSESYADYIVGSAEVVGLMCLRVFTEGKEDEYQKLKPFAMKLGSAFQKINFLRDLKDDYHILGRVYFPNVNLKHFTEKEKKEIEKDIEMDFNEALVGIRMLNSSSRFGVYVAFVYYRSLFKKICSLSSCKIMAERIRISNYQKLGLLVRSYVKHSFSML